MPSGGPTRPPGPRLGILGGTFNPPHIGHLSVARHARRQLGLQRVLLVPVNKPPHKESGEDPGPEQRLAMARLMAEEEPWLQASDVEVLRGGSSYTVDTLRELHAREPDAELTLIVGADMARTLPTWRKPEEILRLARLAVAERDGAARDEISSVLAPLLGCRVVKPATRRQGAPEEERIVFLDMPAVPVSSTIVRQAAARGRPLEAMVTAGVAEHIRRQGLYGAPRRERATR